MAAQYSWMQWRRSLLCLGLKTRDTLGCLVRKTGDALANPVPAQLQVVTSRPLRWLLTMLPLLLFVPTAALALHKYNPEGAPMVEAGLAASIAALLAFQMLSQRVPRALRRLADARVIASADPNDEFVAHFQRILNAPWQFVCAGAYLFLPYFWLKRAPFGAVEYAFEAAIAAIFGLITWRILVIGWVVGSMRNVPKLNLLLHYPDKCGGLEPLGDLCLWNSLMLSIGGVYLSSWIIVAEMGKGGDGLTVLARAYEQPYLVLLVIIVAISILALFLPLYCLHNELIKQGLGLKDAIGKECMAINDDISTALRGSNQHAKWDGAALKEKQDRLQLAYQYAQLPLWPVNYDALLKFAAAQAVPILTLTGIASPIVNALSTLLNSASQLHS